MLLSAYWAHQVIPFQFSYVEKKNGYEKKCKDQQVLLHVADSLILSCLHLWFHLIPLSLTIQEIHSGSLLCSASTMIFYGRTLYWLYIFSCSIGATISIKTFVVYIISFLCISGPLVLHNGTIHLSVIPFHENIFLFNILHILDLQQCIQITFLYSLLSIAILNYVVPLLNNFSWLFRYFTPEPASYELLMKIIDIFFYQKMAGRLYWVELICCS
jgi:hypothetical protein